MTTRRRRGHRGDPRTKVAHTEAGGGLTLARFSAVLDEHAGDSQGFGGAVTELALARVNLAVIKAHRALIYEQVKRRWRGGTTRTSDGRWELREFRTAISTATTVRAADVKAADKAAWAAARVAVRRVAVITPDRWRSPEAVTGLPVVPRGGEPLDRVVAAYKHQAFDVITALKAREKAAIATLSDIAESFGWDGLPIVFADGWSAGLVTMRFSADRLAVAEPELYAALAITTTRGGESRIVVVTPGDQGDQGDAYAP